MPTTIKAENWDATVSGWSINGALAVTTGGSPPSGTKSLVYAAPGDNSLVPKAVYLTQDANSGDVRVSAYFRFESTPTFGATAFTLFVRSNTAANDRADELTTDRYAIAVYGWGGSGGTVIRVNRITGGSLEAIGGLKGDPSDFADDIWYWVEFEPSGSGAATAIRARLQRVSDSKWHNGLTWVDDITNTTYLYDFTDTGGGSVDGPGYAGLEFYSSGTATIRADDFLFESLADGEGPTAATVSGPSGGAISEESTAFTVTLGSASVGTTTVNLASTDGGDAFLATPGGSSVASIDIADGETVGTFYLLPDATVGARTITPTATGITFTPTSLTYTTTASSLVAGTASFVSSGPGGIVVSATDATGGATPYEDPQWQRNEDGGAWSNLTNGGGVSGATTLELIDGSAVEGVVYRYRCIYTDADETTATSNAAPAGGAQVYPGGPLAGGTSGPSIGFCRFIRGMS